MPKCDKGEIERERVGSEMSIAFYVFQHVCLFKIFEFRWATFLWK